MNSSINPAVGIDLGTTNTVVAVQTDPMGPELLSIPQPSSERKALEELQFIKSVVYFESETDAVVGDFASNRLTAFRSIKSYMGTRWKARNAYSSLFMRPAYISAHILRLAYQSIIKKYPGWDKHALITVPASFNTDQRNDTIIAAQMAGLQNVKLLDEPTAAFYYFFNQNRDSTDLTEYSNILVFDFGGGTLDVSIIKVEAKDETLVLDSIGRSRYNNLGGDDIDLEIATFFLSCWDYESETGINALPGAMKELLFRAFLKKSSLFKEEVEDYLKEGLGLPEFHINDIISAKGGSLKIDFRRTLSLSQYESITGKFFQSKSDLNIYRPIEEALAVATNIDPNFSKEKIDLVLYTGGSTRMIGVQRALKAYFAGTTCESIDEDDACNTVALGAAACRFDEVSSKQKISMTNRLLENIYTRLPDERTYTTIMPLDAFPSQAYRRLDRELVCERPLINLRLPLFRGVSKNDHQLSPMRDLIIPLDQIIPKRTPYEIFCHLTENKTIDMKVIFKLTGTPFEAKAVVSLDEAIKSKSDDRICNVNRI
jgi:molecular chaperone DnaK